MTREKAKILYEALSECAAGTWSKFTEPQKGLINEMFAELKEEMK